MSLGTLNKPPYRLPVAQIRWLEKLTGISSSKILAGALTEPESRKLKHSLQKLVKGCPPEYLTNTAEFYGLAFFIRKGVFIPRPESEFIVDYIASLEHSISSALDLCCGSGALGISVYLTRKINKIMFADRYKPAIRLTLKNLRRFSIPGQVVLSNLFSNIPGQFDLIIFNPPYLDEKDYKGSLLFEPRKALVSSEHGFSTTARFINQLKAKLTKNGFAIVETSETLLPRIKEYISKTQLKLELLQTTSKIAFVKIYQ